MVWELNGTWVFYYCHISKVKTHSASWSCIALLASSVCFSADAELIEEEKVLLASKLVLVKENGA